MAFTVSTNLSQGSYKLRMKVIQPGFNLNWIEFDYTGNSMGLFNNEVSKLRLFPNPANDFINIQTTFDNFEIEIYDLLGRELTEIPVGKLYIRNQKLYITK